MTSRSCSACTGEEIKLQAPFNSWSLAVGVRCCSLYAVAENTHCTVLKASSGLQFGVSRRVREVLLALCDRVHLSEVVSEFGPKTWQRDSPVDVHTGTRPRRTS